MRTVLYGLIAILAAAGVGLFVLSAGSTVPEAELAAVPAGDADRGELVFWAGGCASCHAAPKAEGADKLKLGGGLRLETPFGVFVAPNISTSDTDGIGAWSLADLVNAMRHGTAPDGANYYPAFPYTSYARMELSDIADLHAFLTTLPAVAGQAAGHELGFPFNIRRAIGLWKWLYASPDPVIAAPAGDSGLDPAVWRRGRYLVEGPGHCGECHTPRNPIGGPDLAAWLAGAPVPAGDGKVPNITPSDQGGLGGWSVADIAYYLESGFTPDYDSVGGEMVAVQENMARLSADDRAAIAAYLKAIPAHASP